MELVFHGFWQLLIYFSLGQLGFWNSPLISLTYSYLFFHQPMPPTFSILSFLCSTVLKQIACFFFFQTVRHPQWFITKLSPFDFLNQIAFYISFFFFFVILICFLYLSLFLSLLNIRKNIYNNKNYSQLFYNIDVVILTNYWIFILYFFLTKANNLIKGLLRLLHQHYKIKFWFLTLI
jgi:hypothetical protein